MAYMKKATPRMQKTGTPRESPAAKKLVEIKDRYPGKSKNLVEIKDRYPKKSDNLVEIKDRYPKKSKNLVEIKDRYPSSSGRKATTGSASKPTIKKKQYR